MTDYQFMDGVCMDHEPEKNLCNWDKQTQEISFHKVIGFVVATQTHNRQGYVNIVAVDERGNHLEITFFPVRKGKKAIITRDIGEITTSIETHQAADKIFAEYIPATVCATCKGPL